MGANCKLVREKHSILAYPSPPPPPSTPPEPVLEQIVLLKLHECAGCWNRGYQRPDMLCKQKTIIWSYAAQTQCYPIGGFGAINFVLWREDGSRYWQQGSAKECFGVSASIREQVGYCRGYCGYGKCDFCCSRQQKSYFSHSIQYLNFPNF